MIRRKCFVIFCFANLVRNVKITVHSQIPLVNTFTLIIYGYILNNISNIPNYQ